jgi:hypothetical protein
MYWQQIIMQKLTALWLSKNSISIKNQKKKIMKTKFIVSIVILSAVVFTACKKKKEDVITPPVAAKKVYVAGYEENSSGTYVGRYWVDTSASIVSVANADVEIMDIEVVGSDRYIYGEVSPNSGPTKYTIWKNGTVLYEIPYNSAFVPTRMAVSGTDIYLCGNSETTTSPTTRPAIWKNGTVTVLSQGYNFAYLSCIYLQGSNVYTAGIEYSSTNAYFSYWANGTRQSYSGERGIKAITASGTDVYISSSDENNKPAYWKNGTKVVLPVGATSNGVCYDVKVIGADVYACGIEYVSGLSQATYWKNGIKTTLAAINSSYSADAYCLEVDGNDVYVGGAAERNANGDYSAVVWKNGVLTNLTPASSDGLVTSVKVR